jgi:hypothetical protein
VGNIGTVRHDSSVRLCGLRELTAGRRSASRAALLLERQPDLGEAVFSPALDTRMSRLRVTKRGRCAVGRVPLPDVGGALVAYLRVR